MGGTYDGNKSYENLLRVAATQWILPRIPNVYLKKSRHLVRDPKRCALILRSEHL